jgi:phosphoribosylformylglycinamidine synthase
MKAHVYVTLKTSVLDPQGQTIQNALRKIGFADVTAVRQGKYFALSLADGLSAEAARALVERISREVLTNPVIEEFTYRIEELRPRAGRMQFVAKRQRCGQSSRRFHGTFCAVFRACLPDSTVWCGRSEKE